MKSGTSEYHKQHYLKNKKHILEVTKKYSEDNKEKKSIYLQGYYLNHKEVYKERTKKWFKTPLGKRVRVARNHNRRTIEQKFSKITPDIIQEVYESNIKKFGTLTCELCFNKIFFGEDNLEHFIPIARYKDFPNKDLNHISNLGVAHGSKSKDCCNVKKHSLTLNEWFNLYPEYKIKRGI